MLIVINCLVNVKKKKISYNLDTEINMCLMFVLAFEN